ncbi:MAG TPA: EAL domain-containing protein [Rudaea sp.]|nr:EAL domain-containing protein [Rudaea sp.]
MQQQEDTQQTAELRLAFLRHLPKRLDMLRKRGQRLCGHGWDINALTLLFREIQPLAGACGRYGLLDIGEQLFSIERFLSPFVSQVSVPDAAQTEAFAHRLRALEPLIASLGGSPGEGERGAAASTPVPVARERVDFPLQVTPPADYWRRFTRPPPAPAASTRVPATPAKIPAKPRAAPPPTSAGAAVQPVPVVLPPASATAPPPAAAAAPAAVAPAAAVAHPAPVAAAASASVPPKAEPHVPAAPRTTEQRKVYHLSDGNPLAGEIDQRLDSAGLYELTILDNVEHLREILGAFPPHLVIVDAAFESALESIGALVKSTRARARHRLALLSFSTSGELPVRLRAMRAGADAFVALPAQADEVTGRIAELLAADSADPYRILIVEDDRSQAIFAESILRKAGMTTCMVTDPLAALDQLDAFRPELILMDLYMPACDGMELTAIIREREAFVSTPIVFLSGEQNEEKHFEALDSGGDDFLAKPIRPKHLISAVTNRVRRARQLERRGAGINPRDPVSGLYQRAHVIDQINAMLTRDDASAALGGLMYIEIDSAARTRERIGMLAFDALLGQLGAFLAAHVEPADLATRYGDASFLLLCPQGDEAALVRLATGLRDRTARESFDQDGRSYTLSLSFGICSFAARLGEVGAMLNAAERAMADARRPGAGHVGIFHSETASAPAGTFQALGGEIRSALKADSFQLLFQPIVALQGAEVEQFQALLRLAGNDGKLYTAAEIVPIAQRDGLIAEVDRWVMSRCLLVLAERARQQRNVRLFVNQSIETAGDVQHRIWLRQMLETRRLDADQLVIEFRMADAQAHLNDLAEFAGEMRGLGVHVALSAFEASAVAFQLLDQIPATFVKIGPRYTEEGLRTPAIRDELREIVTHAHAKRMEVIAPRIENAQSAALLWTAGVDFIQGDFVQQAGQDLSFDFHAASIH